MRQRPVGERELTASLRSGAQKGQTRVVMAVQRVLLAALITTTLDVATAPAAFGITDGETNYINDMTSVGMGPPVSVPMFLNEGYRTCSDVRGGNEIVYEASLIRQHDTGLSPHQSGQLIGFAIKDLCPDQLYKLERH
jgi:hypothetical protein